MHLKPGHVVEKSLGLLVAVVALGYAVQLGFEVQEGDEDVYYYTNIAVAAVFAIETAVAIAMQRSKFLNSPKIYLNLMDCALTLVAILDTVFLVLGEEYFLLRFFKVLKIFRVLWVLTFSETFTFSLGIFERVGLHFIFVLTIEFAVLYCNALLVTKFVGGAQEFRADATVQSMYGDLTSSLSTLFQLCTFQMNWSSTVGYVLERASASTGIYVWVVHVECLLVWAYLWFVTVMGGIFKALLDEKLEEEKMTQMKLSKDLGKLKQRLLEKNAELLDGDGAFSDQEDETNPKSVKKLLEMEDFASANRLMGFSMLDTVSALEYLTDRAETVEQYRANAIKSLFTLNKGVNKLELYQSSSKMLSRLQQTLKIQREDTEELRHNVSVLSGLLQQNIQTAAQSERLRMRNQEWTQEREQLRSKNERLAADIINVKRQLQAAKVEAAAARTTMGQNLTNRTKAVL